MMFSMKKREEIPTKTLISNEPPPPPHPRPVSRNPLAWKLLGPAYMSHLAEIFRLCHSMFQQKKCNCLAISLFYIFGLFPLQRNTQLIVKGKHSKSLSLDKNRNI